MPPSDPPTARGESIPSSVDPSDFEVRYYLDGECLWVEQPRAVPREGESVMFNCRDITHSAIAAEIGSIVFEVRDVWWSLHTGLTLVEVYLTEHDRTRGYQPADGTE